MAPGGALGDLAGEGADDLVVEAAAEEQEAATDAAVLDGVGDRALDVDLGQDFDEVAVRYEIVAGRLGAAQRLVQHRLRRTGGVVGNDRAGRIVGADPFAVGLRGAQTPDLHPVRAPGQRRGRRRIVPVIDDQRQRRQPGQQRCSPVGFGVAANTSLRIRSSVLRWRWLSMYWVAAVRLWRMRPGTAAFSVTLATSSP